MIRLLVMYPNNDEKFDMEYYLNSHIPMCHTLLDEYGLVRTEVDQAIDGGSPDAAPAYRVIAHLVFRSMEDMQKGLQAHDPKLGADVPNFTTIQPQFQISEIVK